MKFLYKKLSPQISRPIIPIGFSYNGGEEIFTEALIDSGADMNLLGKQFAELLGIPVRLGKYNTVIGISGKQQPCYEHVITLRVGGWTYQTKATFLADDELPTPLLGQRGFFDLFKVSFDYLKKEVEIKQKA